MKEKVNAATQADIDEKRKLSEDYFKKKCDDNKYFYLYIDQTFSKYSTALSEKSKRPDYVLCIPYFGSLLVDVKAYDEKLFYPHICKKLGLPITRGYNLNRDEIGKFLILQNETSMKVWFAVVPKKEGNLLDKLLFLPVDMASKFVANIHKTNKNWEIVQVPEECFRDCSKLSTNKCGNCQINYCDYIESLAPTL